MLMSLVLCFPHKWEPGFTFGMLPIARYVKFATGGNKEDPAKVATETRNFKRKKKVRVTKSWEVTNKTSR